MLKRAAAGALFLALAFSLAISSPAFADQSSPWNAVLSGAVYAAATTPSAIPGAPKVVFAGTNAVLVKSTDGCLTWTTVLAKPTFCLAADPFTPGTVYAATAAGLYKTVDYGQIWSLLNAAIHVSVTVSPFNGQVVFGDNSKSSDGGATWKTMAGFTTPGLFAPQSTYSDKIAQLKASHDPAYPGLLLYTPSTMSVLRSDDNGETWYTWYTGTSESVEIDPVDARYIYVSAGYCQTAKRFYPGGSVSMVDDYHGFVVDPSAHNKVYAVNESSGTLSLDYGATWNSYAGNNDRSLPAGRMFMDADSGIIYLPTFDKGLLIKNSWCLDADHDGASPTGALCGPVDCNDALATRNPFKLENCFNALDENCNDLVDYADPWCVSTCVDLDADGHYLPICGGDDCNDNDVTIYTGAPELCDDKDNNCNHVVDEGCTRYTYYRDADGDGYGSLGGYIISSFTTVPAGYVTNNLDCWDYDANVHPGVPDVCADGMDNDCDGTADNGCPTYTYYYDYDWDGYGDPNQPYVTTVPGLPSGFSLNSLDCDDYDGSIFPGAPELCDWIDNSCNGVVDEGCSHPISAWGDNAKGQIGDGTTTVRKSPVTVPGIIALGISAGSTHSLAVKNDWTVLAWGNNASGQLGDNTTTTRKSPVAVLNSGTQTGYLSGVIAVSAGLAHSLALKKDGTVWAWGDNSKGQLGDGTGTLRKRPVQVLGLTGVMAIASGDNHNLALLGDGTVWAWGDNSKGQLGDGTTTNRKTPILVGAQIGMGLASYIAAGGSFSLASDGWSVVYAWGDNSKGQLGDGTTTTRKNPTLVQGLSPDIGVWGLAAGSCFSLATMSDGTVYGWGDNSKGQLGDGTIVNRKAPVKAQGLTGVTAITAGSYHSLAMDNGTLMAWGDNSKGQLGDGTLTLRKTPIVVPGQSGVVFFDAGGLNSLTLK